MALGVLSSGTTEKRPEGNTNMPPAATGHTAPRTVGTRHEQAESLYLILAKAI